MWKGAANSKNKELQRECIHLLYKIQYYPSRSLLHRSCPLAASVLSARECVCVCDVHVCVCVR